MDMSVVESYPRYDRYKNSGVDWLGDIPEDWETKRLKYVVNIKKRIIGHEGVDVLSITQTGVKVKDITTGEGQLSMDYSKYQIVHKGDFAMNHMDLLTGYVDISKYDGVVSPDYRVFINDSNDIDSDYLLKIFQMGYSQKIFFKYGQGVSMLGRWRLPADNFYNFLIPIPTLDEQTKVIEFLQTKTAQIDQAIALKQQQIAKLEEYKQIVIQNAVTKGLNPDAPMKDSGIDWIGKIPEHWEVKKLKFITTINRLTLSENTNKDFKFNYVDIGSVTFEAGIINSETLLFRNAPSRARRIAKVGDTIVSTVRTYLKAIDYIDTNKSNYIYSTGFAILSPYKLIQPRYLTYFVWSDAFTRQVRDFSKGVSYPAINSSELGNLFVVIPSTNEQIQVIEYINKHSNSIRNAINNLNDGINRLKEYKTILINQAVTGKIKVS